MKELIEQYIAESTALIQKQADEISLLKENAEKAKADWKLDKQASEDTLNEITNLLSNEQYTQDSVVKAIQGMDTACLVKEASETPVDDWGDLDETVVVMSNNIRPSERKLYRRLGLI